VVCFVWCYVYIYIYVTLCVREELKPMSQGENPSVLDSTGKRKMELNSALADVKIKERRTNIQKQKMKCVQEFVDKISLIDSDNGGSTKSVSVKEVAEDMDAFLGLDDLALIEKLVMRKYEKKYGEVPKTDQFWVEHVVNVYTEKDRSLIEDAIMACI